MIANHEDFSHDSLFPDEAFDAELSEIDFDDTEKANSSSLIQHWALVRELHKARQEITGGPEYLSRESELELGNLIQAGVEAEDSITELGAEYDGELDTVIETARQAQHDLVVANLPFAAYFARASVGIVPRNDPTTKLPALPGDAKSWVGTYANVAKLANPQADLEDRTQTAMEAMWRAARTFKPDRGAKFITHAAWTMQRYLTISVAGEVRGWDVGHDVLARYYTAQKEEALYGVEPATSHMTEGKGRHPGYGYRVVFEGRRADYIDDITRTAPEEETPGSFDEGVLALDDIVPSHEHLVASTEHRALTNEINAVLGTLSAREAGIVTMRFGLDDGVPKVLDEAAKVYGVTRERARQLEAKSMSKIRHPSRSEVLRDYLYDATYDSGEVARGMVRVALTDGAVNIRHERSVARKAPSSILPVEPRVRPATLESWQVDEGESWGASVRD